MPFEQSEKFEVIETEVWDASEEAEERSDIHQNLEAEARPRHNRRQRENAVERTASPQRRIRQKTKKKTYNWAFFLASFFIGLGITATFDTPIGLFSGLGVGFLFFVDPIYEKVMERLNDL